MTLYLSKRTIFVLIIATVLFIGTSYLSAWTAPAGNPPNNNVAAPINIGGTTQNKSGNISAWILAALTEMRSNRYCDALGAECVTISPTQWTFTDGLAATQFLYTSDQSLKTDIKDAPGLEAVMQLQGKSFAWKNNNRHDIGLIAQEVEVVLPQLVHTGVDGLKRVEYANLVAVLIEAIKEQQAQISELQSLCSKESVH